MLSHTMLSQRNNIDSVGKLVDEEKMVSVHNELQQMVIKYSPCVLRCQNLS